MATVDAFRQTPSSGYFIEARRRHVACARGALGDAPDAPDWASVTQMGQFPTLRQLV
jgi:hypothetical protein